MRFMISIMYSVLMYISPLVMAITNEPIDSAEERSAKLVVSLAQTAYASAYMKSNDGGTNAGETPLLSEVATHLKLDLEGSVNDTLTVTTKDGVTCVFEINNSNELILEDGKCGDIVVEKSTKIIGTLTVE